MKTDFGFESRHLEVEGRGVMVDCYGETGPAVVLLHGIPGWRGTWSSVAMLLADRYRVFVPDLQGFGQSQDPSGDIHARGQAQMIVGLLNKLDLKRVNLVGFDFGGPVALHVYRRGPMRIVSLTLCNTNLLSDTPIPGPLKLAPVPVLGRLIFKVLMGYTGQSLLWLVAVRNKAAFPRKQFMEYLHWPRGVRWTQEIFYRSMRDLAGLYREVQETLTQLKVPCLVIWADRDPFFPVAVGERIAELAGAKLVVIEKCGHFVPEEYPLQFAELLGQVLGGEVQPLSV